MASAPFLFFACGSDDSGGAVDARVPTDAASDAAVPDASVEDAATDRDAGQMDGGAEDAGTADGGTDGGSSTFPTLEDYRTCTTDTDCPVGLGECVTELSYDHPDGSGATTVVLSDLFDGLGEGEGVCTRSCVTDETACDTLTLRDATGTPVPFECQVVAVGGLPYPEPTPSFPFDDTLDFDQMATGRSFAALCRPPFGLDDAYVADFCGTCTDGDGCAGGVCWRFDTDAPVSGSSVGTCLSPVASGASCPLGFEARELMDGGTSLGEHCVPVTETCGACQDRDGDGFGAGHCTREEIDCDDTNVEAYYDPTDMDHAFPTYCGEQDYNCNGLSDEAEQVGVAAWEAYHCEYCGDDYDGVTVNAGTDSEATLDCVGGVMQVASCATSGRVHCTGDPRTVGCEATASSGGAVYYRDFDSDTYGDPSETSLGCPSGAPAGYVSDDSDCDDSDGDVHPGVVDLCNCWGDCAASGAQVDDDCDGTLDEDVTGYLWFYDSDADGAGAAAFDSNEYCGAPASGTVPGAAADCEASDATAYGSHLRVTDSSGTPVSLPMTTEPPRDGSGELYTTIAAAATETCDGVDDDCDGTIDDGVTTTYYRDADSDGYGDPATTTEACSVPSGYVANADDCDDGDPGVHPGAAEVCDGVDQNCAGGVDEGVPLGGSCDTGLTGMCSFGTETACVSGSYECTQLYPAEAFDDPDPTTPEDEDCDGPETVIYVSPSGIDSGTGGLTPSTAVRTLAFAISRAQAAGATQIHARTGTYSASAQVALASGIDLVGGFSDAGGGVWDWTGAPTTLARDGTPTFSFGPGRVVALLADGAPMTLAHFSVSVVQSGTAGIDHYGVVARNTNGLRLSDVSIDVAAGTDGSPGAAGGNGGDGGSASGSTEGTNGACFPPTGLDGGAGGKSFGGDGQGPNGGAGSSLGSAASPGGYASGGTGGRQQQLYVNGPYFIEGGGGVAPTGGVWGSGGGGGSDPSSANRGGGGGAGGCPGSPGENGQHGGGSFGVFSVNSTVVYDSTSITFGGGGAGGQGGNGGRGGAGGDGGAGGSGTSGGAGGSGGGGGGAGGGGYGGHAFGVFHQGDSDPCTDGTVGSVVFTAAGTGGSGGASGARGNGGLGGWGFPYADTGGSASAATPGLDGATATCFWSRPCTGDSDCTSGYGYCRAGHCY